jgi:phosphatidylinositol alpha-1,6-mannosyltransferase
LIVGDGSDRERLEALCRQYQVTDNVRFIGWVPDHELPLYYAACDVFVMVSEQRMDGRGFLCEGFGIVYSEANACGKPVIAAPTGGVTDSVLDKETGLFVKADDLENLEETIVKLLEDVELAERLGKRGRQRVEEELSKEIIAERVAQLVNELSEREGKESGHSLGWC